MKKGKLLIFSAPSGSGKTTLLNYVMSQIPEMAFSVSATTRPPRGEEVNGKEYYFLTMDDWAAATAPCSPWSNRCNSTASMWPSMWTFAVP